jgi:DNA-directed RNA polymerase specialized sigma24 family protein
MDRNTIDQHLSQMSTAWTVLLQAHRGPERAAALARAEVLDRYGPAAYRYLLGATRDPDAADELFQEFALKLVRGDLHRVDPSRGRFRQFLKATLYRLVADHRRRRRPLPLTPELGEPVAQGTDVRDDRAFVTIWREELIGLAWKALESQERRGGQPLFTVLRFRADHPDLTSPESAEQLSAKLGRPVGPEWVRKWLRLGRAKFAELLVAEVARTLDVPSRSALGEELGTLGLLEDCRAALGGYGG